MSIPLKDELLVPYLLNWNTRFTGTGYTPYQITEEQVTKFTALFTPYQTAYNAMMTARGAGTRSKAQTTLKDTTKASVLTYARMLYASIQLNTEVADNLKDLIGVEVRKARPTPTPVMTLRPAVQVTGVSGRTISLRITDGQSGGRLRRAAGAVAAWVYYYVGSTYPSDPLLWSFAGASTKYDHNVVLPLEVSGTATVWVCAAWINAKQEAGPVSVPQMTHLQGGGVQTQTPAIKIAA